MPAHHWAVVFFFSFQRPDRFVDKAGPPFLQSFDISVSFSCRSLHGDVEVVGLA
jgi:hypothetical protein